MHLGSAFVTALALVSVAACSVTNNPGDGTSGSPGTPAQPQAPADGGGADATNKTDSGSPSDVPAPSSTEAPVAINGTCATFSACGGSPQGTYDYTAGCVADTFNAAKAQCPALDTTNAKVSVKGSLYFETAALTRNAVVKVSGSIVVPASCSSGQCAAVEAALKSSFDSVTCTGSSDCTCTVAKTTNVDNNTTFTVSGHTVTTGDGESYEICEQSNGLRYTGKSLGSENGDWQLVKRP